MEVVTLKPLFHRNEECIGIYAPQKSLLNHVFQKKANAKWSKTQRCWYLPCTEVNYKILTAALRGVAHVDVADLRKHLTGRKKTNVDDRSVPKRATAKNMEPQKFINVTQQAQLTPVKRVHQTGAISDENYIALKQFRQQLILKSYSPSTIKTYTNEFSQFLQIIKDTPAHEFSVNRIKNYLQYCFEKLKLSENTLHSRINALKFYYEQVLKREKFFWEIPRPKKPLILPRLLNEDELRRLFSALANKKHKAMLFTAYSAGLRVSEIVNLKIQHIDSKRMQIFISRAKGKKDRYVNLSPLVLDILRKYLQEYKPSPKTYLFESEQTQTAYPTRTVQQIFANAKHKAGINKEVGVHSLRHSFATHLLDKGTDIKYIKDLLGHFNIKTTERYLHVSKKQLVNIASPFDDLYKDGEIDW